MNDCARIGEREAAVSQSRHFPEWARLEKFGARIGKAGRLKLDIDALLCRNREHLARVGRERGTIKDHGRMPPFRRRAAEPKRILARWTNDPVGEHSMRSNSGKDESRNNMRDPTMRD